MPDDVLVRVEGVSKKFCRDLKKSLWYGLADTAADLFGGSASARLREQEFWAVDGVSLELRRGECLGLIGRNGAGKTTLLKMLNGLIRPDKGRIEIRGRVGALISLGAGFNPILTGRENIFINGSVLGLTTKEIEAKLDAIVDFADINEFIDAPVQSYSSGMQVRLGFAVATALQPDVLLLDEVLAVGDAAFRAKCYDRLATIRNQAAFVLVSHDTDQIARVCSQVLVVDAGVRCYLGEVGPGIEFYNGLARHHTPVASHEHVAENVVASLDSVDEKVGPDGVLHLLLSLNLQRDIPVVDIRVTLWGDDGLPALDSYTRTQQSSLRLEQGLNQVTVAVGPLRLKRGRYPMSVVLLDRANNLHLYWGDRIRSVAVDGPVAAAAAYTPALRCHASPRRDAGSRDASPKAGRVR